MATHAAAAEERHVWVLSGYSWDDDCRRADSEFWTAGVFSSEEAAYDAAARLAVADAFDCGNCGSECEDTNEVSELTKDVVPEDKEWKDFTEWAKEHEVKHNLLAEDADWREKSFVLARRLLAQPRLGKDDYNKLEAIRAAINENDGQFTVSASLTRHTVKKVMLDKWP
jgi:hypothetical protein